jgi:hypothetical protein
MHEAFEPIGNSFFLFLNEILLGYYLTHLLFYSKENIIILTTKNSLMKFLSTGIAQSFPELMTENDIINL